MTSAKSKCDNGSSPSGDINLTAGAGALSINSGAAAVVIRTGDVGHHPRTERG